MHLHTKMAMFDSQRYPLNLYLSREENERYCRFSVYSSIRNRNRFGPFTFKSEAKSTFINQTFNSIKKESLNILATVPKKNSIKKNHFQNFKKTKITEEICMIENFEII